MKLLKLNSLLIIIMLLFSAIYAFSSEEQNKEMEQLMKKANSDDFSDQSELNRFYMKEKNKHKEIENLNYGNKINSESNSDSDTGNTDIQLLETNSEIKTNSHNTKKNKQKSKNQPKSKNNNRKNKKNFPTAKLINQFNPWFPKKKWIITSNTGEKYCKYKNGFLHLAKNANKLGETPLSIKTVPVFVSLNMISLNVQMGVSLRTLFSRIKVENILKITKKFKNANCFEVIEDNIIEESFAKTPIVLCASNSKSLADWVKALQQFKDCIYNIDSGKDGNKSETLIDFNRVNKLLKTPKGKIKVGGVDDALFYDKSVVTPRRDGGIVETVMKTELGKIVGLLEEGKINEQQKRRTMDEKLNKASKIETDIRRKKAMIDKIMDTRLAREKDNEDKLKADEGKKRELQLLKAVRARIAEYKVN
jgi:hypothetical protein